MSIVLGTTYGTSKVYELSTDRRLQNTVVYGTAGSGKTRNMLLSMAIKQIEDSNSGATFICGRGGESWLIDRLANKLNREVIFLHPGVDKGTRDFIESDMVSGKEMQENLIDYAQAIEDKKIVIIDFDVANYRTDAKEALKKLLYHFQRSIVGNSEDNSHYVYIDDAENKLPYIQELLAYGSTYAIGTTLFLSSYSLVEARSRELAYFLNAHCRTTILMNQLTYEDYSYFERRLYGKRGSHNFMQRPEEEVVVEGLHNGVIDVRNIVLLKPSLRWINEIEDEVHIEQDRRNKRRRPRTRAIVHEVVQTSEPVDTGFDRPSGESRVFLDESVFFDD